MMEKRIVFKPAKGKREWYYIFYLSGKHGTIQFLINTNWRLPHLSRTTHDILPEPSTSATTASIPIYEGQAPTFDLLRNNRRRVLLRRLDARCEDLFQEFLEGGNDAVWQELNGSIAGCSVNWSNEEGMMSEMTVDKLTSCLQP
jgi:hypothetical protein